MAEQVDAVLVSHGHPDHCADLHPLLRARVLRDDPAPPLPIHTVPDAVTKVLALDRPGMLDDAYRLHEFAPGDRLSIGPFDIATWLLPHFVLNAGMRLAAGGRTLAYTGDTGPSPNVVDLARDVDLFLAEATFPDEVPADSARFLSSAGQAGENAAREPRAPPADPPVAGLGPVDRTRRGTESLRGECDRGSAWDNH